MSNSFSSSEKQFRSYMEWLEPRNSELHQLLCETLSEDLSIVQRATNQVELRFDPPLAACALGLALIRRGEFNKALGELELIVEKGNKDSPFYGISLITLGQIHAYLGNGDIGAECLRKAKSLMKRKGPFANPDT